MREFRVRSLELEFESGIGDFAKVAVKGLTVLCQNFGGGVEDLSGI